MEEPADPNFVEDMADVEARNYENQKEKGTWNITAWSCSIMEIVERKTFVEKNFSWILLLNF